MRSRESWLFSVQHLLRQVPFLERVLGDFDLGRGPSLSIIVGTQLTSHALAFAYSVDIIRVSDIQGDGDIFPRYHRTVS